MERVVHALVRGEVLVYPLLLLQRSEIIDDVIRVVIIQVDDVDLVDVIALCLIFCSWRHLVARRRLFWSLGLAWRRLSIWVWSRRLESPELVVLGFWLMYLRRYCIRERCLLLVVTDVHASYLVLSRS